MRRILFGLLLVSLVAISLSCSDSRPTDPAGGGPYDAMGAGAPWERRMVDRGSPDGLIEHFARSYAGRRPRMCSDALDVLFEFEFTPDVADSMGLPEDMPWWGKDEDMQSTRNMFQDNSVVDIDMALEPFGGMDWEVCARDFIGTSVVPPETTTVVGLCRTFEPDIRIHIEKEGEEPWILWVNSTLLDIMVRPDPDEPGAWSIVRIKESYKPEVAARDIPAAGLGTEGATWGSVKSMFR
jgi:hypothetical protein